MSYFVVRPKVEKYITWKHWFYFEIFLAVSIVGPLPYFGLKHFGIDNLLLNICLFMLMIFAPLHHISVIAKNRHLFGLISPTMHGPISHTVMFTAFGVAGILCFRLLLPMAVMGADLAILYVWLLEMMTFSMVGIMVGFKVINLWYT